MIKKDNESLEINGRTEEILNEIAYIIKEVKEMMKKTFGEKIAETIMRVAVELGMKSKEVEVKEFKSEKDIKEFLQQLLEKEK